MQDGSSERYGPNTLPSEVYSNKSFASKILAKVEADGGPSREYKVDIPFVWSSQNYILMDDQSLKKDLDCL
jgi:hypothetical protein